MTLSIKVKTFIVKWRLRRIFGDSDSSPLHLFILRLQLSNTWFSVQRSPVTAAMTVPARFQMPEGRHTSDLPQPFFGFCVCFFEVWRFEFPQRKAQNCQKLNNFWHPARFRILRRRISIRDSDFGKLPDSYPTRVGFAYQT